MLFEKHLQVGGGVTENQIGNFLIVRSQYLADFDKYLR
jgi:hypothetical protein